MKKIIETGIKECLFKEGCPYLNFASPEVVLAERDYLRKRVEEMERIMGFAEQRFSVLYQKSLF